MAIRVLEILKGTAAEVKTYAEFVLRDVTNFTTIGFYYHKEGGATACTIVQAFTSVSLAAVGTPALDDCTASGTFTGTEDAYFEVAVDASVPDPDTFKWRKVTKDGAGAYTEGVACAATATLLSDGVSVTFGAVNGHTIGDSWKITCMAA